MPPILLLLVALIFFVSATPAADAIDDSFHFVLVHGGGHGSWCWYKVSSILQNSGHTVDAVDLLSAGINNVDVRSVTKLEIYSRPLVHLLEQLPDNKTVVLVGHSLAGASLTYALERFPDKISAAVYVAALMLPSGPDALAINNQLLSGMPQGGVEEPASSFDTSFVKELLYNLSPFEDVVLAKSLLKPVPLFDPTVNFTSSNYGRVPRYFVKTMQDRVVLPVNQELLIRTTPPTGVFEVNSDHAPFFSAPQSLVNHLVHIASEEN